MGNAMKFASGLALGAAVTLAFALSARGSAMRDVAHQIADAVYEKVTGIRGAFTRIAYVTAIGTGKGARYAL